MDGSTECVWFVALLIVRARVEGEWKDDFLVDHQVRLLRSPNREAAYERALALGSTEEFSYRNAEGALVTWEFCGLADLQQVQADELADGLEIYSWLSNGRPEDHIMPKNRLSAFWIAANAERSAKDLLD